MIHDSMIGFFSVPEGAVLGKTDMWSAGVVIYVILASQLLGDCAKDDMKFWKMIQSVFSRKTLPSYYLPPMISRCFVMVVS